MYFTQSNALLREQSVIKCTSYDLNYMICIIEMAYDDLTISENLEDHGSTR